MIKLGKQLQILRADVSLTEEAKRWSPEIYVVILLLLNHMQEAEQITELVLRERMGPRFWTNSGDVALETMKHNTLVNNVGLTNLGRALHKKLNDYRELGRGVMNE